MAYAYLGAIIAHVHLEHYYMYICMYIIAHRYTYIYTYIYIYMYIVMVAIEQNAALGRIPRARQRLLVGYPPKLLEETQPRCAFMSLGELALKAIKLEV